MKLYLVQSQHTTAVTGYPLHQAYPGEYILLADFEADVPDVTPLTKEELDRHFKGKKRAELLKQLEEME